MMSDSLLPQVKWGKFFLVFCLGFFSLSVQTLLFRDFLSIYEGTELAIGIFFFTWFFWIAAGAFAGKILKKSSILTGRYFDLFLLIYIPAYMSEYFIIFYTRELCGITPYELFPLLKMIPVSFFALAPVSFCTGLFFPMACTWMNRGIKDRLPVTSVYIAEVSGGFAGGVFVTIALTSSMPRENVFLFTSFLLCAYILFYRVWIKKKQRPVITWVLSGIVFLVVICLAGNLTTGIWTTAVRKNRWSLLLPSRDYQGSFSTSRGLYHYGEYKNVMTVVSGGVVCESFPDPSYGAEIAALHLVQHPGAQNILVIGQGALPVCREFFRFPQIQRVVWATPDHEYAQNLMTILPPRLKREVDRLEIHTGDIHRLLSHKEEMFDCVIIHLQDPTTLALNSFFTREFYLELKTHISPGGLLSVRTRGGENYLGSELIRIGASVFTTLQGTFRHTIVVPGEQSWICASDGKQLSGSLSLLKERYVSIQPADYPFPAQGLDRLYEEERAAFQEKKYVETIKNAGRDVLINTINRPKAMLHSLLFSLKQGANITLNSRFTDFIIHYGFYLVIGGIFLYCLFRSVYRLRSVHVKSRGMVLLTGKNSIPRFDTLFLVFSAGLTGISVSEVLIFFYQLRFGSLYIHIGLISALFMLGLCAGSILIRKALLYLDKEPWFFTPVLAGINLLLFVFISLLPDVKNPFLYIILFFAAGMTVGSFVPVAAFRLKKEDIPDQYAGSIIDLSDHLGATIGGFVTGVVFVPVAGASATLLILSALLCVNLVFYGVSFFTSVKRRDVKKDSDTIDRLVRTAGYCMGGICLFLFFLFPVVHMNVFADDDSSFSRTARIFADRRSMEARTLVKGNHRIPYYYIRGDAGKKERYIFSTEYFAPEITGYSGPLFLAVMVDASGTLLRYTVLESTETPVYLDYVSHHLPSRLIGKNIFDPGLTGKVDSLTGATMTSTAIIHALSEAGTMFAYMVLGKGDVQYSSGTFQWGMAVGFFVLLIFLLISLVLRKFPSLWGRRIFLAAVVILFGIIFNLQYSTDHLFRLGFIPFTRITAPAMIVFITGIPFLCLLFGNIYCGYLCPFGALQELVGEFGFSLRRVLCPPGRSSSVSTGTAGSSVPSAGAIPAGKKESSVPSDALRQGKLCPPGEICITSTPSHTRKLYLPGIFPDKNKSLRFTRYLKYLFLCLLALAAAGVVNPSIFVFDPLTGFFRLYGGILFIIFCLFILGLSFFYPRIWCRNLCPAGAFLSLTGRVRLLRFFIPRINPRYCDMGVRRHTDMDCLCCDRCRIPAYQKRMTKQIPRAGWGKREWVFLFFILVLLLGTGAGQVVHNTGDTTFVQQEKNEKLQEGELEGGSPREVNMDRLEILIQKGYLSDHEAEFYKDRGQEGE